MIRATLLIALLFYKISLIFSQNCGTLDIQAGLVVNGEKTKRGEFPFLVALYKFEEDSFFCAGNLITRRHVLSAAHCFQDKNNPKKLTAEDVVAVLGKYNILRKFENGVVHRPLKEIILPDDWKWYTTNYDWDIALLVLVKDVEFTSFIRPICLPPKDWINKVLEGGTIAGWGFSERSDRTIVEAIPRKTKLEAPPTNEQCFLKYRTLASISSEKTFCAGGNNKGACSGDSGGGFYIELESTWFLQGIISSAILDEVKKCDNTKYTVYSNVVKYLNWINDNINVEIPKPLNVNIIRFVATTPSTLTASKRCPNKASVATYPHCCLNGAVNDYCCLNGANNIYCCLGQYINPTCSITSVSSAAESQAVIAARNILRYMKSKRVKRETAATFNATYLQKNNAGTFHKRQFLIAKLGDSIAQVNEGFSILNTQTISYPSGTFYGSAIQINKENSAGNIQINDGTDATQHVEGGYSFNLQYNLVKCTQGDSKVTYLQGNLQVRKCAGSHQSEIEYDGGDVIYKIYLRTGSNDDFMTIKDGKVFITFYLNI